MNHNQKSPSDFKQRSAYLQNRIEQLNQVLGGKDRTASELRDQHGQFINLSVVGQQLFAKASAEFLERKEISELAEITRFSHQCVQDLVASKAKIQIRTKNTELHSQFFIAMQDQPFIVNSISECIRDFGQNIFALLHPIFMEQAGRISFSYVELPRLSEQEVGVLERRLQMALEQVLYATEDFTSTLVRAETLARMIADHSSSSSFPENERKEISRFLRWLTDGGYIFLGYCKWPIESEELQQDQTPEGVLGILKQNDIYQQELLEELRNDANGLLKADELLSYSKLRSQSVVHRRVRLHHVCIREFNSSGSLSALHSFVGILTSKAYAQESSSVPLIREKLKRLLQMEGVIENSHDYKHIVDTIDSMPKEEALQMRIDELHEVLETVSQIQNKNETRISIRFDNARRSVSALIVMPRDCFNSGVRNDIQNHLEQVFGAIPQSSDFYLDLSIKLHARLYFNIPLPSHNVPSISLPKLKAEIADLTRSWSDNLEHAISLSQEQSKASALWYKYSDAFADDYKALYSVHMTLDDIQVLERISIEHPIDIGLSRSEDSSSYQLSLYHLGTELTISKMLPILENTGLEVINEQCCKISPRGADPCYLHRFVVRPRIVNSISKENFENFLRPGLIAIFNAEVENDLLNSLLLSASLSVRSIRLLRTYCSYLWQVNKLATRSALLAALAHAPSAANQLWNMFEIRFNPQLNSSLESRQTRLQAALKTFHESLRDVNDITQDRILRSLADLLVNTVRTNFYLNQDAIVLKVEPEKVEIIPKPRPKFEAFVRSSIVEGVHLRHSRIARGGLRWSERPQDFRTEVLGLVKTQQIKNALIVPAGAKGGFIVRNLPADAKEARAAVERSYKGFIRALLSITDNRIDGKTVHPENCIVYDGEDPYFVVAADKGTATFSDIANKIAVEEFNFWLGDAFASGGSQGYDHKLYGITAKGAWECVKRHFKNIGINYQEEPFTAIGIGDMAGDVFGNGLLLSDRVKLIAAFNHKHIFLDPDPDPTASFAERKRLFELPGSQWSDYDKSCISAGGGVFGRFDKEITLSPQIREALDIAPTVPESMNGEQLISLILRARVDLLWNGGIGTYVKSSAESNVDVGDAANDLVRINADKLRVKVVGEGGNLGFTQLARIDFARRGGNIFTDAIDNSGGVDLSDHEVNLKILFTDLIREGKLTIAERNELLRKIAPDVVRDVLDHNENHARLLTIGVRRSSESIEYFRTLLREIELRGYVDRDLENLPQDEALRERALRREGLLQPELAICIAGVKMWVSDELLKSNLLLDPLLEKLLFEYFPASLRECYRENILQHALRRNIIACQASNMLVHSLGITFLHRMCLNHSAKPITVIKCALASDLLFDAGKIRNSFSVVDTFENSSLFVSLNAELGEALRGTASWLLRRDSSELALGEIISRYKPALLTVLDNAEDLLVGETREIYKLRLAKYTNLGLELSAARRMAAFPHIAYLLEMIWAAQSADKEIHTTALLFSTIMESLDLQSIEAVESLVAVSDKWEHELLYHARDDIRRGVATLTLELLDRNVNKAEDLRTLFEKHPAVLLLRQSVAELKEGKPSVSSLAVIAKQVQRLSAQAHSFVI